MMEFVCVVEWRDSIFGAQIIRVSSRNVPFISVFDILNYQIFYLFSCQIPEIQEACSLTIQQPPQVVPVSD